MTLARSSEDAARARRSGRATSAPAGTVPGTKVPSRGFRLINVAERERPAARWGIRTPGRPRELAARKRRSLLVTDSRLIAEQARGSEKARRTVSFRNHRISRSTGPRGLATRFCHGAASVRFRVKRKIFFPNGSNRSTVLPVTVRRRCGEQVRTPPDSGAKLFESPTEPEATVPAEVRGTEDSGSSRGVSRGRSCGATATEKSGPKRTVERPSQSNGDVPVFDFGSSLRYQFTGFHFYAFRFL